MLRLDGYKKSDILFLLVLMWLKYAGEWGTGACVRFFYEMNKKRMLGIYHTQIIDTERNQSGFDSISPEQVRA